MFRFKLSPNIRSFRSLSHNHLFFYRLLFFGSDIISQEVLIQLHFNYALPLNNHDKILTDLQVVSHHRSMAKGKFPIHEYCQKNKLIFHEPLSSKSKDAFPGQWTEFLEKNMKEKPFDLGLACSFGYMIPDNVIDLCKHGIIIIHPSLLPKYRGAAPVYHALLNNEKISGISFIDISRNKFDAGSILLQKSLEIKDNWNYKELALGLGKLAGENVLNVIKELKNLRMNAVIQNEKEKSGARKIKIEETYACWVKDDAEILRCKYKAFSGSNLHALKTIFQEKIIFIEDLEVANEEEEIALQVYKKIKPGGIYLLKMKKFKNNVYVNCRKGWVKINKWKFPTQMIRENHKFINQFLNKESIYKSVDNDSPYNFDNFDPKYLS